MQNPACSERGEIAVVVSKPDLPVTNGKSSFILHGVSCKTVRREYGLFAGGGEILR